MWKLPDCLQLMKQTFLNGIQENAGLMLLIFLGIWVFSEVERKEKEPLSLRYHKEWMDFLFCWLGMSMLLCLLYPALEPFLQGFRDETGAEAFQRKNLLSLYLAVPTWTLLSYTVAMLVEKKSKRKKIVSFLLICFFLIFAESLPVTFSFDAFTSYNPWKIDAETRQVSDIIGEGYVLCPEELAAQLTEYESGCKVYYGDGTAFFDATNMASALPTAVNVGADVVVMAVDDVKDAVSVEENAEQETVTSPSFTGADAYFETALFTRIGNTEHYVIYRSNE